MTLLELLVDIVAFLSYLIIIRGAEGACICCAIALQFSVNSNFTVAWLIDVASTRLLIDETDY